MLCKHNGFTLVELLIAISILAIVAVLGWRGLDGIVRSRDALTSELEQTRALQLTFAQMQSDCSQNLNPQSYPNIPEGRSIWIEPQRLILVRNEFADNQAPSMSVVVYRLKDSNLTRFESVATRDLAVLKQILERAKNPPDNQVEIVMQKNVQNIEFAGYPESSLAPVDELAIDNETSPETPPNNNPNPNEKKNTKDPANNSNSGTPSGGSDSGKQLGNTALQKLNRTVTTGLQVSLQLQKHDNKIIKIFMLGGA